MRIQLVSYLFALALAAPGMASADRVTLPIGDDGFDFGLIGLDFEYAYEEAEVNGAPVWQAGPYGSDIRGRLRISAPFGRVDLTSDGAVTRSVYTFGRGTITASASWTTPQGTDEPFPLRVVGRGRRRSHSNLAAPRRPRDLHATPGVHKERPPGRMAVRDRC